MHCVSHLVKKPQLAVLRQHLSVAFGVAEPMSASSKNCLMIKNRTKKYLPHWHICQEVGVVEVVGEYAAVPFGEVIPSHLAEQTEPILGVVASLAKKNYIYIEFFKFFL